MERVPVLAAGGIVVRRQQTPLIAVVRLRKRDEWVLPKGKLDAGETPRAAAEREVWEETGHGVSVHEFLGTLVYETASRSKVVHYWRMEANGPPSRELTSDVRAVDWLPLDAALERLSRTHERAFLAQVGPLAIAAARQPRVKQPAPAKRRSRPVGATEAIRPGSAPLTIAAGPDAAPAALRQTSVPQAPSFEQCAVTAAEASIAPAAFEAAICLSEAGVQATELAEEAEAHHDAASSSPDRAGKLMQKLRGWLRGAA